MPSVLQNHKTIRYAVLGGLLSIPLIVGSNWLIGVEDHFSTTTLVFGGLLAGYLARGTDADAAVAGAGAGAIGGVPGYIWILPQMIRTATSWSSTVATVGVLFFMAIAVIAISTLTGGIGGVVGGWIATKFDNDSTPAVTA
jgi:hypothetical protein